MAEKNVLTLTPSWSDSSKKVNVYVTYVEEIDTDNNRSKIICGMNVITPNNWDIGPWSQVSGQNSYVGTTSLTFDGSIPNFDGTRTLTSNKSFFVNHNPDGTGTATISWKWACRSSWAGLTDSNNNGSFTITLTPILRDPLVRLKESGTWKQGKPWIKTNGAWVKGKKVYIKDGVWKETPLKG